MKKLFILIFSLITLSLAAQDSFTGRYQQFRSYHYQTPWAWNRIRREVATKGKEKWPLMKTERLEMTLAGGWKGLIPSPTPANTYFFKEVEDMGNIYSLILKPDAYGYVVYPFKLEQQFKLSENELLVPRIIAKGFMNTLVTDVPYETEMKLDEIVYTSDTTQADEATVPEAFDEGGTMGWLKEAEYYDLYNVKNFYCYFDNRPDTLRNRFKYTTQVTEYFGKEVSTLAERMRQSDLSYICIPYWMTDVYLQVPAATSREIHRFGYPGYVIEPTSGTPQLTNGWNSVNMMDFAPYKDIRYDLVAYCGDALSTNRFLGNRQACRRFIHTVLGYPDGMINRTGGAHKPNGLNLYLPEFDFTKKRALTQLVKSLSLVIDSFRVNDSVHIYNELDLSLTFSRRAAVDHSGYISGLQCFVDTVYFADFDSLGLAREVVYNNGSIDTSSMVTRVTNPFYLFRIPYKNIQPGVNDADIWQLMDCDYASGQWGLFFCIDLCIILLLIAIVVLRCTSVEVNVYAEKYRTLVVLLMITLVMEFIVFFFFMIEALSPQVIYFDLETGNLTYLMLIGLPVLPILLYLLLLQLDKREPVP
ncbi:hypothetical protein [Bacteroides sp.]